MKLLKRCQNVAMGILFLTGVSYGASLEPKTPEQVMYELNLHFESGKADINPQYDADIKKVADELKNYPSAVATIEGYTDSTGSQDYNLELSRRRADSLKQYLQSHYNVDPRRVNCVGFGETKPVASNDTHTGMQRNRTVLVTVNRLLTSQQDQQKNSVR